MDSAPGSRVYHQDEPSDSQTNQPTTEDQINRLTGESDRWAPSLFDFVIIMGISGAALLVHAIFQ